MTVSDPPGGKNMKVDSTSEKLPLRKQENKEVSFSRGRVGSRCSNLLRVWSISQSLTGCPVLFRGFCHFLQCLVLAIMIFLLLMKLKSSNVARGWWWCAAPRIELHFHPPRTDIEVGRSEGGSESRWRRWTWVLLLLKLHFCFSCLYCRRHLNDSYLQNQHISAEVLCFDSHTTTSILLWLFILV